MLNWFRTLIASRPQQPHIVTPDWLAGAVTSGDVESRLLRLEQRAGEFGLRLP